MVSKNKVRITAVTPTGKAVEEEVAEPIVAPVVEPVVEVQSYLVQILFKREPIDKDIPIADIFYHKEANLIELMCHKPNYHSELEMIAAGDISVSTETGAITMVSKSESPISWITKLYKSREFSGNPFIAGEAQPIYET